LQGDRCRSTQGVVGSNPQIPKGEFEHQPLNTKQNLFQLVPSHTYYVPERHYPVSHSLQPLALLWSLKPNF
jgi:hypothetical protein